MRTLEVTDLCKGMGNILGIFARNSYFVQNNPWRIIGVQVGDLNVFDTIPGTTDTVMDLVLKLSKLDFRFNPDNFIGNPSVQKYAVSSGSIYALQFLATSSITTDTFCNFLDIPSKDTLTYILNPSKCGLDITLYLRQVSGVSSEELSKMYINEIGSTEGKNLNTVVPVACSGTPDVRIHYSVCDKGPTEDLVFTFDGSDRDFEEFLKIIQEKSIPALQTLVK